MMKPPVVVFLIFWSFVAALQAQSLGYVLQAEHLSPEKAAALAELGKSGRDVLVLDEYFRENEPYTKEDLATIRAGQAGRKILAYLSIGEAENYRPYWQKAWKANLPAFLLGENPDWPGNFRVKYWSPEWQSLILAALDRILKAGFDGIYLDIVDAFEGFEYDPAGHEWRDNLANPETGRSYREDMTAWVGRLAGHARSKVPGFWIVPQNATQLLEKPSYSAMISAVGVEDLFTDDNRIQSTKESRERCAFLEPFLSTGKPVFVIEYASREKPLQHAIREARAKKFSLLVTDRELRRLGRAFPPG